MQWQEMAIEAGRIIFTIAGMWLLCGAVILREEIIAKLRQRHHP